MSGLWRSTDVPGGVLTLHQLRMEPVLLLFPFRPARIGERNLLAEQSVAMDRFSP